MSRESRRIRWSFGEEPRSRASRGVFVGVRVFVWCMYVCTPVCPSVWQRKKKDWMRLEGNGSCLRSWLADGAYVCRTYGGGCGNDT